MSKGQQDKKDGSSYYGFDSTGLEKAATVSLVFDILIIIFPCILGS